MAEYNQSIQTLGFYDLSSSDRKKGWVVIIKNSDFGEQSLPHGNEVDNLSNIFGNLAFHVRFVRNRTAADLLKDVNYYAEKPDSSSLLIFISSHGNYSSVACMEDTTCKVSDILNAMNSGRLANKPKCLFIDACRSKSEQRHHRPEIPGPDFLFGMSSLAYEPSFVIEAADVYLGCIVKVFEENFRNGNERGRDMKYLMAKVNRDVYDLSNRTGYAQNPVFESTLRSSLIF